MDTVLDYTILHPSVIKHGSLGNPRTKWRFELKIIYVLAEYMLIMDKLNGKDNPNHQNVVA